MAFTRVRVLGEELDVEGSCKGSFQGFGFRV